MFMLAVRDPFSVDRIGRVQLIAAKDRTGRFRRGEIAAEVVMDATVSPYQVRIDPPPNGAEMSGAGHKRKADDRVLQVLNASAAPLSAEQAHRLANDDSNRLPGEATLTLGTVKNAMTRLATRPNVSRMTEPTGVGKAFRHLYAVTDHKGDA